MIITGDIIMIKKNFAPHLTAKEDNNDDDDGSIKRKPCPEY